MLSSISPVGERARHQRWWLTAGAYLAGSAVGGLAAGSVAALVAAPIVRQLPARGVLVALAATAAAGVAVDAATRQRPPSWRRQVDERWLDRYRGWVYGLGFGVQLGTGVATVVASSATYVTLVAAALTGSVTAGAAIGAVFGTVRALPLVALGRVRDPATLRRVLAGAARLSPASARTALAAQATIALAAAATLLVAPVP